ncbi:TonB family protein [Halioglobus sp.]|nr:TonB family protein [Halioglobus sp.]
MYYLDTADTGGTRFKNAVVVALLLHAAIVMGVTFKPNDVREYAPQIEVTLTTLPAQAAPDDAKLIAQSNQDGQGQEAQREQFASPGESAVNRKAQALERIAREAQDARQNPISTANLSRKKIHRTEAKPPRSRSDTSSGSLELDRLSREIASLEAKLSEKNQPHKDNSRVRRLSAASAKQSFDAAYLLDWRRRLEAVGNQYYPTASVRYGIYGDLRMLVVIRADGSLEEIRVLASSGYAVLDEAAIKLVRMASPFAPFPPELKATTDKLEIVRTWYFQENQLSSP